VMAQPAETLGTLGTQLLLERIEGRAPEQSRVVVLPAQFVVRRSCGDRRANGAPRT
jgi:LacI family transcriptional regulator, galactose operon repressor